MLLFLDDAKSLFTSEMFVKTAIRVQSKTLLMRSWYHHYLLIKYLTQVQKTPLVLRGKVIGVISAPFMMALFVGEKKSR